MRIDVLVCSNSKLDNETTVPSLPPLLCYSDLIEVFTPSRSHFIWLHYLFRPLLIQHCSTIAPSSMSACITVLFSQSSLQTLFNIKTALQITLKTQFCYWLDSPQQALLSRTFGGTTVYDFVVGCPPPPPRTDHAWCGRTFQRFINYNNNGFDLYSIFFF